MIAVAIAGILASLAGPTYTDFLYKARVARTVAELHGLAKELQGFALSTAQYPDTLAQIGRSTLLDPWGNPYQYTRINCDPVTIGHLNQPDPPDKESDGRIVPVTGPSPTHETRVFLAVGYPGDQELIHLVASKGGGSSGGGGGGSTCGSGKPRKDHFLHPINSDFDIYSMGRDGDTVAPLTANKSHDDIIRANDGGFYGLAANF
jgi:general secretion pathway protein G